MTLSAMREQTRALVFHTDPGHGWLQVPLSDLSTLGIADRISRYSYTRDAFAFLEEDCDAPLYLEMLKAHAIAHSIADKHTNSDSFIRSLPHYAAQQGVL